jgi:hypothetical protein
MTCRHLRRQVIPRQVDDRRGGAMNWSQLARHTATAIGIAFVIAAGIYFAIRFSLFAL